MFNYKKIEAIPFSLVVAGFVTVLIGITSSVVLVIQAAQHLGATPIQVGSWIWALGMGMGIPSILFSIYYKQPVILAWSTASAAMLLANPFPTTLAQAYGSFILAGILTMIVGFSGWFEKALKHIPQSIGAGMLAGILVHYGVDIFTNLKQAPYLVGVMGGAYLIARLINARYAVIAALIIGVIIAIQENLLEFKMGAFQFAMPVFISPEFTWQHTINIAIPLFLVTMTSQNIPGITIAKQSGYRLAVSPIIGWTGVVSTLLAPFGAFSLNLAAITAAICMGNEAHHDPKKRYIASVIAGGFYCLVGICGLTVAYLFLSLPKILVMTLAGLALLNTILSSLTTALGSTEDRDAALLAFLCTASGVTLAGIGSAFWGLVLGLCVLGLQKITTLKKHGQQ